VLGDAEATDLEYGSDREYGTVVKLEARPSTLLIFCDGRADRLSRDSGAEGHTSDDYEQAALV
jgi:hypothetical protein